MSLLTYNLLDKCIYLPISLNNNIVNFKDNAEDYNTVEEGILDYIFSYIEENESQSIIVDFCSADSPQFTSRHYELLIKPGNAMVDLDERLYEVFKEKAREKKVQFYCKVYSDEFLGDKYLVYFDVDPKYALQSFLKKCFSKLQTDYEKIEFSFHKYIVCEIIGRYLVKNSKEYPKGKYLETSNIYVNYYINVKHLFLEPALMSLVISELKNNVKEIVGGDLDRKDVCILGASNNGVILSKILAYNIGWSSYSIDHVGPRYCLDCISSPISELSNKKYILISDVFCLGAEYKVTKGMIHILNSELLGAVGVVKIKDVYRSPSTKKDKVIAIVNDINKFGMDYKIEINEGEFE